MKLYAVLNWVDYEICSVAKVLGTEKKAQDFADAKNEEEFDKSVDEARAHGWPVPKRKDYRFSYEVKEVDEDVTEEDLRP